MALINNPNQGFERITLYGTVMSAKYCVEKVFLYSMLKTQRQRRFAYRHILLYATTSPNVSLGPFYTYVLVLAIVNLYEKTNSSRP